MEDTYKYLLDIALILISTKVLGMTTRKIQLPQVVGALLAGLVLGPAFLGIIEETTFITNIAEIGVIILMFTAGMETDITELKKSGPAALLIALLGVLFPLLGGYIVAHFFNHGTGDMVILQNIFIGVVLTATSVSITVETLRELGKLSTKSGNAILGAALIDDLLGILGLTVITSFADTSVSITTSMLKILGFFVFVAICGVIMYKIILPWFNSYKKDLKRFAIFAFTICLIMSYASEKFFGVSDITGAFVAGILLANSKRTPFLVSRFDTLSFLLLSPVFFANVGLKVRIEEISTEFIILSVILFIVAVITKVIGCGLGAKICKYTNLQAAKIGFGMVSRGEVALIVATKGIALGLMPDNFFAPLIIMVIATTIFAPIALKLVYKHQFNIEADVVMQSELVNKHESRFEYEKKVQEHFKNK